MSTPPLTWWEETDRDEVARAVRRVVPAGGLVVLSGDDLSGRSEALRIAQALLTSLGYTCYGGSQAEVPGTMRTALALLLEDLVPNDDAASFRGAFLRESILDLFDAVKTQLVAVQQPAVALLDIDQNERLLPAGLTLLQRLASEGGCPVVVTSRSEMGTRWSLLPQAEVLALRPFTKSDVYAALQVARPLRDRSVSELQAQLDTIFGNETVLDPLLAYTFMRGMQ